MKTTIIWYGQGGELQAITVNHALDDDDAVRDAFIEMLSGNIVNAGDSFVVRAAAE